MPISQATLILLEVERSKPISAKTREFQHRRFQNRIRAFLIRIFRDQQKKTGLTQKGLAERIDSRPEQVNRWLSIPGNLTINTICDLLLGMGVDLDDPSATPLADLVQEADKKPVLQEIQEAANSFQIYIQAYPRPFSIAEAAVSTIQPLNQANTIAQPLTTKHLGLGELERLPHIPSGIGRAITGRSPSL